VTPIFLPLRSVGVLISERTIKRCKPVLSGETASTGSAPRKAARITESPPPTENWISPASSELTTREAPPPITMTSGSTPYFLNKPRSSATHMAPWVALTELKPTRNLS
jgi:hypothetical protein